MEVKPVCHLANLFARTDSTLYQHVTEFSGTNYLCGKRALKVEVVVHNCTCVHAEVMLFKFTNILLPKISYLTTVVFKQRAIPCTILCHAPLTS